MCVDPATLTVISTLVGVAGSAVSGIAQSNAATAAAQQADNNAIIAKRNAADARARGIVAEQDTQMRTRAMLGKQKNVLSERNIDVGTGSALDILGDTAMFGKLDALTTRGNFEREAIGNEAQSYNYSAQADQSRMAASASMFGTGISMFQTALGGAGEYMKIKSMSL